VREASERGKRCSPHQLDMRRKCRDYFNNFGKQVRFARSKFTKGVASAHGGGLAGRRLLLSSGHV
jgi:hypothetical protein